MILMKNNSIAHFPEKKNVCLKIHTSEADKINSATEED